MAFASSVLPLLSAVFAKKGEKAGHTSVSHLLHFATATIKHELSTLVLKISLALVATGVLIFSIIMIGRHVNDAFQVYYANGPLLAGLFFGFISVLCFAGLFLLFRDKGPPPETADALSAEGSVHHMAHNVLHSFLSGLNEGLSEGHEIKKEKIVMVEDDESDLRDLNVEDYRNSEILH